MIPAEFVGGPWCGEQHMLPDLFQNIEVIALKPNFAPMAVQQQEAPMHSPETYTVGRYELRAGQRHAGPYFYDWRGA